MRIIRFLTGLLALLLLVSGVMALTLGRHAPPVTQALNSSNAGENGLVIPAARQPETVPDTQPATPATPSSPLAAAFGQTSAAAVPALETFIASLPPASPETATGLYIPGRLAAPIVEQPPDDPAWVSPQANQITHFRLVDSLQVLGLLGHNTLAGAAFFDLHIGDVFFVTYGDGNSRPFIVADIQQYQALIPDSPNSDFIDLQTGQRLSASDVFNRTYGAARGGLVLQTCIARDNLSTWGRIFILAQPLQR